jgi:3-hydroxyisobutyrate dehydrogenase-like beta-hydroxyacid dehydrogenase
MPERSQPRIGVLGLGTMGGAMAAHIARAGFPLAAWNRTAALHLMDLGSALDVVRESGAVLPIAALAAQLGARPVATGHADDDMSTLARPIRGLSGLQR